VKRKNWSIVALIPTLSSLIVLLIVVLISAFSAWRQYQLLYAGARQQLVATTKLLASSSSVPLIQLDVAQLRYHLSCARRLPNLVTAIIFDRDGRILTDGTLENPRRHEIVDDRLQSVLHPLSHLVTEESGDNLLAYAPIFNDNVVIGGLECVASTEGLQHQSIRLFMTQGCTAVLFGVFFGLLAWIGARRVTQPLQQLIVSIDGLTGTGRAVPLPRTGPIEIQQVSASFSRLLTQLRDTTLSRETLAGVMDGIGEGLLVLREDGIIDDANRISQEMSGRPLKELKGLPLADLLIGEDPEKLRSVIDASLNDIRRTNHYQSRIKNPLDPEGIPVLLSFRAATKVGGLGFIITCLVQDIRELKKVEEMKTRFLAAISHELRTPLTSIKGTLGLLAGGAVGVLPSKAQRLVEIASESTNRMLTLINDLLDLEKAAAGKLQLRCSEVDLGSILERARDLAQGLTVERKLSLNLEIGSRIMVHGDPDRLHQIMMNFLSNACKYAPEHSTIDIRLFRHNAQARVEVADRGPGVPAAFQKHLFKRFAQAEDGTKTRTSLKGSGLGLPPVERDNSGGEV